MSLQDYATRKYDALAFQPVDGLKNEIGLALYSEDTSGRITTGIQKLAQRWALEFLTEKGSMPFLPERGNAFMVFVRRGRLRTQIDVISTFVTAGLQISRNLRAEEYAGMPDDERFDSAELLNVEILPGYINIRVMIMSRAGISRAVVLPIETLP